MDDIAEVYFVSKRKARKPHRCDECYGTITAGETYCFHHGVFDGQGFSYKVCVDCESIRTELNKGVSMWDQICVGGLCESVFDNTDEIIKRFVVTKIKRGATIPFWMAERFLENDV